ncbi:MAG: DUF2807 domain-containing protein [Flavobacteriaceae bacterium]|nr:DUF2807 domain-containing protein [Flavobacteriaceae bacterium]
MKQYILIIAVCLSTLGFSQKVEKSLGDFTELKAFDQISVKLVKADENKAVISGDHTDKVQILNKNGVLKIRLEIEKSYQGEETYVTLYYKTLYVLDANEGAFIISDETMNPADIELKAQEGAGIDVALDVKRVTVKSVSGGQVKATGIAKNQDATVNSGGMYKGKALKTEQTNINVSTGGNAKIHASEVVKAKVKAGGNIKIYGNPKVVDKKTVLGGNITQVN